jgi:hypothetical protein
MESRREVYEVGVVVDALRHNVTGGMHCNRKRYFEQSLFSLTGCDDDLVEPGCTIIILSAGSLDGSRHRNYA